MTDIYNGVLSNCMRKAIYENIPECRSLEINLNRSKANFRIKSKTPLVLYFIIVYLQGNNLQLTRKDNDTFQYPNFRKINRRSNNIIKIKWTYLSINAISTAVCRLS